MGLFDTINRYRRLWGAHFRGKYDKLIAYVLMVVLTTASITDVCVTWETYFALRSPEMASGLVTGGPGPAAVTALHVFAVVTVVTCIVETVNVVTLMYNGGHVVLPVEVEQAAVLLLASIPVAAINLTVVICRHGVVATGYQLAVGLVSAVKSGLRMYFYGVFKEYQFRYERSMYKWTVKIAIYVSTSVAWVMLFLTQCFVWHHARMAVYSPASDLGRSEALSNVSVVLVNNHTQEIDNHDIRLCNDSTVYFPDEDYPGAFLLIPDLSELTADNHTVHRQVDVCQNYSSTACTDSLSLRLAFSLSRRLDDSQPFGELQYTAAVLDDRGHCHMLTALPAGLDLRYVTVTPGNHTGLPGCVDGTLGSAWGRVCHPPKPRLDLEMSSLCQRTIEIRSVNGTV